MENNKVVDKKKNILPIVAAIIVVAIIIAVAILVNKKNNQNPNGEAPVTTETGTEAETPDAGTEGEAPAATETAVNPVLEGARVEAPGADLIAANGQVVNQDGKEVKTDVAYNSPEAPKQTMPVAIKDIPTATKLTLDANGFNPKEFKIGKGKALTIAMTGSNDSSHVFAFEDPILKAVYINVRPGETRAVTFNAPDQAGEYKFFCDFPGHKERGETGVMIVE